MNKLPPGWVNASLDAIADILDFEREPINASERESRISGRPEHELYPYYGATGQVGFIDSFRSEGERVLLGEDAAPFLDQTKDKAYLVNGKFWVNNHAHILCGAVGLVDNKFLCHQLNIVDYHTFVTGSTRLKLTNAAMRRISLAVAPVAEQTRIVSKIEELLSELDAGVAELKAARKKLQQYRQSLLNAVFEGVLTSPWREAQGRLRTAETGAQLLQRILIDRRARWEAQELVRFKKQGRIPPKNWQEKYPEPKQPNSVKPPLPVGWVWATIDQLSVGQRYGSSARTNEDSSGVPVLRMGNIQEGRLDYTRLKYLPMNHVEFPELFLEDGDLLFNRTNSPELVGKTAVYRSAVVPCSYASYLIAVRFNNDIAPEFVSACINSAYGRHWVRSVAVQQTGQANVNGSKLAAFALPLPPANEQAEAVGTLTDQLANAFQQVEDIEKSLRQAEAQRQNILRAAFAGQLVPQDPGDEPASVLMQRIRTERDQRTRKPKLPKSKQDEEVAAKVSQLLNVLEESDDWVSAQDAFRRCGVTDGSSTDQIEAFYAELRSLDNEGRLACEPVLTLDKKTGRTVKTGDRLKLVVR